MKTFFHSLKEWWHKPNYSVTRECPRCHSLITVGVYGSADQLEYGKCICGFEIDCVI